MTTHATFNHRKTRNAVVAARWTFSLIAIVLATSAAEFGCTASTAPTPQPAVNFSMSCPAGPQVASPNGQPVDVTFATPAITGGTQPVTTSCSPSSGSSFSVGTSNITCQASDAAGHATSCGFAVTVNPPARAQYTRYMSFGDSITYGIASDPVRFLAVPLLTMDAARITPFDLAAEPYPLGVQRRLAGRFLQSFAVINEGVSGEVAYQGGIARFHTVLLRDRPEVVLLMEGTNDLLNASGIEPALAALDNMVVDTLNQGRRVCLATIPPQRPNGLTNRGVVAARVPPFNDRIRAIAAARNVPLVDVYNAMKDDLTLIGIDDLHPTTRGIGVIADTFTEAIRANFGQSQVLVPQSLR
jgi:lysophospholipase L1-like esterase